MINYFTIQYGGDNSTEEWIGPYDSGVEVKVIYNWTERGSYLLQAKVKDKYGGESNFSNFEINMPKIITFYNMPKTLLRLFERFPFL